MATKPRPRKPPAVPPEPPPFHFRFEIALPEHDVHKRFVNRVSNLVFENFIETDEARSTHAYWRISNALGEEYKSYNNFKTLSQGKFLRALQCIEVAYTSLDSQGRQRFEVALNYAISLSEVDLGVAWEAGHFRRAGSSLLDSQVVNDPLGTLSDPKYLVVREPLVKALTHLLEAERRPELYSDAVTDAYEALEACSKIVTGRSGKDLSGNAESLVSLLPVSSAGRDAYRSQLKAYIAYGNLYRHAKATEEQRSPPTKHEAEAFIYQTGIYIRLATAKAVSG